MTKPVLLVACLIGMVVIIVGLDVFIFRDYFWARLIVNVGIVLVFIASYLRFLY